MKKKNNISFFPRILWSFLLMIKIAMWLSLARQEQGRDEYICGVGTVTLWALLVVLRASVGLILSITLTFAAALYDYCCENNGNAEGVTTSPCAGTNLSHCYDCINNDEPLGNKIYLQSSSSSFTPDDMSTRVQRAHWWHRGSKTVQEGHRQAYPLGTTAEPLLFWEMGDDLSWGAMCVRLARCDRLTGIVVSNS